MDNEPTGYHQPAVLADRRAAKVAKAREVGPRPVPKYPLPQGVDEGEELGAVASCAINAAILLACSLVVGAIGYWVFG